ncbi:mitochondrial 54S ribosomal protein YmL41 [Pestalotiopsis sp. IQ-011]
MASAAAKTFRTGTKQVFLPDHVVTLCRPHRPQPPQFATFQVPLTFNKLDIRDYLLHAYKVNTRNVRSHLAQRPPRLSPFTGRIGRPPPIKYMTVELEKPFVFPAEPAEEEHGKWHTEEMQKRVDMEKEYERRASSYRDKGTLVSPAMRRRDDDRNMLAKQAQDLLEGKVKWGNERELDPRWQKTASQDQS